MDNDHEYRLRDLERAVKDYNKTHKDQILELKQTKVDKLEFKPVQLIVNGLVASILMAFIGAVIALVMK